MDWSIILHTIAEAGNAAAPVIASGIMVLVGVVFYQLTGFLPGFVRAYIEKVYRDNEAKMSEGITRALRNGIATAMARGMHGGDALSYAIDHAIKTRPEAVAHFKQTSNMDRQSLAVMAEAQAVDLGLKAAVKP